MAQGKKINKKQWEAIFNVLKPKLMLGMTLSASIKASKLPKSSIYQYIKDDEKAGGILRIEIEGLRSMVNVKSIENIVRDIDPELDKRLEEEGVVKGSLATSTWWAERKMKEDFSLRVENANTNLDIDPDKELSDAQKKNIEKARELLTGDFLEEYEEKE